MTQQHKHLIVRADIGWCPQEEDLNKISDWIRSLIKKIDMKLLAGPYTTYVGEKGNKGIHRSPLLKPAILLYTYGMRLTQV